MAKLEMITTEIEAGLFGLGPTTIAGSIVDKGDADGLRKYLRAWARRKGYRFRSRPSSNRLGYDIAFALHGRPRLVAASKRQGND